MRTSRPELIVSYAVLVAVTAITMVPLVQILLAALTPADEVSAGFQMPSRIDFSSMVEAWTTVDFSRYLMNSVIISGLDVVLTLALAIPAAYGFARLRFPGANAVFLLILVGLMVPEAGFVVPLYFNLRDLGLTDTYAGLVGPQTAMSLGFTIFWLRNYFLSVPTSILEAARIDGARDLQVLWHVLLPPARPAITTAALLVGMWTWNGFLLPLALTSAASMRTAPLGLAMFQGEHMTDYSLLAAAGVIISLPIVLLFLFLQRHFISGMLSGAVKG